MSLTGRTSCVKLPATRLCPISGPAGRLPGVRWVPRRRRHPRPGDWPETDPGAHHLDRHGGVRSRHGHAGERPQRARHGGAHPGATPVRQGGLGQQQGRKPAKGDNHISFFTVTLLVFLFGFGF